MNVQSFLARFEHHGLEKSAQLGQTRLKTDL